MRPLIATVLLLTLGADYPRHRRFVQPNLPHTACTPATGTAITNTGWRTNTSVGLTLTIAESSGTSPGCANDYSLLVIPATSGVAKAFISDDVGTPAAHLCPSTTSNVSFGVWVSATASGTTDICTNDPSHGDLCYALNFVAGEALYKFENKPFWVGSSALKIGNDTLENGGTSRSASTIKVWGARCNVGATLNP